MKYTSIMVAVSGSVVWLAACGGGHYEESTTPSMTQKQALLIEPNPAPENIKVALPSTILNGVIAQESVFNGFGCNGQNKSLAIKWQGAPAGTQSYAIVIHDPDAPTGVGFFHWLVWNIPASVTSLPVGGPLPEGAVQGTTDFGTQAYGGPCPPPGAPHRYIVTVYALKVPKLELGPTSSGAIVRFILREQTLALGRVIGTYARTEPGKKPEDAFRTY